MRVQIEELLHDHAWVQVDLTGDKGAYLELRVTEDPEAPPHVWLAIRDAEGELLNVIYDGSTS